MWKFSCARPFLFETNATQKRQTAMHHVEALPLKEHLPKAEKAQ
jgi:hypothetical protein